jgi:hypothetical protein
VRGQHLVEHLSVISSDGATEPDHPGGMPGVDVAADGQALPFQGPCLRGGQHTQKGRLGGSVGMEGTQAGSELAGFAGRQLLGFRAAPEKVDAVACRAAQGAADFDRSGPGAHLEGTSEGAFAEADGFGDPVDGEAAVGEQTHRGLDATFLDVVAQGVAEEKEDFGGESRVAYAHALSGILDAQVGVQEVLGDVADDESEDVRQVQGVAESPSTGHVAGARRGFVGFGVGDAAASLRRRQSGLARKEPVERRTVGRSGDGGPSVGEGVRIETAEASEEAEGVTPAEPAPVRETLTEEVPTEVVEVGAQPFWEPDQTRFVAGRTFEGPEVGLAGQDADLPGDAAAGQGDVGELVRTEGGRDPLSVDVGRQRHAERRVASAAAADAAGRRGTEAVLEDVCFEVAQEGFEADGKALPLLPDACEGFRRGELERLRIVALRRWFTRRRRA